VRYFTVMFALVALLGGCRLSEDKPKTNTDVAIEEEAAPRACFYPDNTEAINDCPAENRMVHFTLIKSGGLVHYVKFDHVFTGDQIQITTYLDELPVRRQVCTQLEPAPAGRRILTDELNSCRLTWAAGGI